jgi:hypothetical protein
MTALIVLQTAAIVLLGLLVAGLLRSHAEILRKLHELGVGEDDPGGRRHGAGTGPAGGVTSDDELRVHPDVARPREQATASFDLVGTTPEGDPVKVGVSGTDHATLIGFLSSGCLTCADFWEAFAERDLDLPEATRLVLVTKGPADESESRVAELAPRHLETVMSSQAWIDYEVPVAPYFILLDGPSGAVLGEGAANTWAQVASLLQQATGDRARKGRGPRRSRRGGVGERVGTGEERADQQLMRAGIFPGDPSLYPSSGPGSAASDD